MITPTRDDLIEAARLLGYRVCDGRHDGAAVADVIPEEEERAALLATIATMANVHMAVLPPSDRLDDVAQNTAHNVAALAGMIECDGPEHQVAGACCGLVGDGGDQDQDTPRPKVGSLHFNVSPRPGEMWVDIESPRAVQPFRPTFLVVSIRWTESGWHPASVTVKGQWLSETNGQPTAFGELLLAIGDVPSWMTGIIDDCLAASRKVRV